MLTILEKYNNHIVYYGLTTDTLPTNVAGSEKVAYNGDMALLTDTTNNKMVVKVFDEANNTWRDC